MNHYLFIDESGDHGLSFIDPHFPLFLLCGCLIREDQLKDLASDVRELKNKYFGTDHVILHSREIRKCEGAFQKLFDLDVKKHFYEDLNQIISAAEFVIFGSGINKHEHIKKYGKGAKDPYSLSLSFVIERLVFYLNQEDKAGTAEMIIEQRGKKEDAMFLSQTNSILDRGTYYVSRERLKAIIKGLHFRSKKDNVTGLQIADLCAYPLARYLLDPQAPYPPFDIIKSKIYSDEKGSFAGWGLKMFP